MASCQGPRPIPFIRLCFYSSHWKGWWRHQLPVKSMTNLFREIQPIKLPSQIPVLTDAMNAQRPLMNCDFTITTCSTFTSSTITTSTKGDHVKTSSKQSRLFHWSRVSSVPLLKAMSPKEKRTRAFNPQPHTDPTPPSTIWGFFSCFQNGTYFYVYEYVVYMCLQFPQNPEKDGVIPGTEATNGYKLPGRYSWELNPDPLIEWPVLLTQAISPAPTLFIFFFRGRVSCTPRCLRLLLAPLYQTRSLSISKNGLTVLTLLLLPSLRETQKPLKHHIT